MNKLQKFNSIHLLGAIIIHAERLLNVIIIALVCTIDQICFCNFHFSLEAIVGVTRPGRIKVGG